MFKRGHKPEAQRGRQAAGDLEAAADEPEVEAASAGAKVAVVVGEDNAAAAG